ncbi:MAG: ThuA domain-containing protein [Planctomycetes bacterium]|nr:ThuA domain-containing protein [Planctomycetota bacterium]
MLRKLTLFAAAVSVLCSVVFNGAELSAQVKPDIIEKIQAALPASAPAKAKKSRKVLIFSKTNGFRHGSIAVGAKSLAMLGEKTGAYTAVHSEDDSMFEADKLKEFDAVIMLNTTGELFRPRRLPKDAEGKKAALEREERLKKNLVDFVKSGKGLAGTHSGTDTYKNWKDYNDMMGGAFAGHPWHSLVPIKNLEPGHVVNKCFEGKGFSVKDEIYQFRLNTALATDRRMLLSLDGSKMNLKRNDGRKEFYPISWVSTYGKGRTFYCSLGHRNEIYYNPVVLQHYLAGFQSALGDLEADGSPSASGK